MSVLPTAGGRRPRHLRPATPIRRGSAPARSGSSCTRPPGIRGRAASARVVAFPGSRAGRCKGRDPRRWRHSRLAWRASATRAATSPRPATSRGVAEEFGALLSVLETFAVGRRGQRVGFRSGAHHRRSGFAPGTGVALGLLANGGAHTQTERGPVKTDSAIGIRQHGYNIGWSGLASNCRPAPWRNSTQDSKSLFGKRSQDWCLRFRNR